MDLPRYPRLRPAYSRLEGQRCAACGKVQCPPRSACRACRERDLEPYRLSGRGTVYSHAEDAQAPRGFAAPYAVALIPLEEVPLVTAQLPDVEAPHVTLAASAETETRPLQAHGPQ